MVPAAVKIAIRQNRWFAMITLFILELFKPKNRCPLTRKILESRPQGRWLSQTAAGFTSAGLLCPAVFAPSVAKKPHTRLNVGPRPLQPAFLRGFAALT